jgi:glycosyltransferase 2 family protein
MNRAVARVQSILGDPRVFRMIILSVGAAVLLYLAAILWFGWRQAAAALRALGLGTLLGGAVLASTSYLWRFLRWEVALRYLGYQVPRRHHLLVYLAGLALTATPGKSGETFRTALLLQYGVRAPHSLAAFLVDRATDVLGMCLLGFLASCLVGQALSWAWLLAFAAALTGSRAFAWLLQHQRTGNWWGRLAGAWQNLPIKGSQAVLESWASLWKLPRVAAFSGLAMAAYGSQALVFALFCQVAGTGLTAATCVLIFVQATLFGAASMVPAGLGAMEAALVFQLAERGVGNGVAVSLAIAIRLVTLWMGMAIGFLSLLAASREPVRN